MNRILVAIVALLGLSTVTLWAFNEQLNVHLSTALKEAEQLRVNLERDRAALERYQEQAVTDAANLASLRHRITQWEGYVEAIPDAADHCFSSPDVDRLRTLWD